MPAWRRLGHQSKIVSSDGGRRRKELCMIKEVLNIRTDLELMRFTDLRPLDDRERGGVQAGSVEFVATERRHVRLPIIEDVRGRERSWVEVEVPCDGDAAYVDRTDIARVIARVRANEVRQAEQRSPKKRRIAELEDLYRYA